MLASMRQRRDWWGHRGFNQLERYSTKHAAHFWMRAARFIHLCSTMPIPAPGTAASATARWLRLRPRAGRPTCTTE